MISGKNKRHLFCLIAAFFLCGCGYTAGTLLPPHLRTIYVENFTNEIDISAEPSDKQGYMVYRAGLENDVTKKIVDQFIFDGHLQIVDKEDADLVLVGAIVDYYKQPLRYDKFDNVEEYRIIVTVNFEVKDIIKNKIFCKEQSFIGYDAYRLTGQLASSEDAAREGAIKDLAQKIVEKVIEGW